MARLCSSCSGKSLCVGTVCDLPGWAARQESRHRLPLAGQSTKRPRGTLGAWLAKWSWWSHIHQEVDVTSRNWEATVCINVDFRGMCGFECCCDPGRRVPLSCCMLAEIFPPWLCGDNRKSLMFSLRLSCTVTICNICVYECQTEETSDTCPGVLRKLLLATAVTKPHQDLPFLPPCPRAQCSIALAFPNKM